MIKVTVIQSNDTLLDETYIVHGNQLIIGKNQSCNMIVDTDNFPSLAFSLIVNPSGMLIKPHFDEPYKVNKKKIKGSKICNTGSIVSTEDITFRIEAYLFEESEEFNNFAKNQIENFNSKMPEVSQYLLTIQEGIVSIEKAINDTK